MGTSSSRRDLDNHESSPSFYSPLWLMPPPRPNPSLRLMPPLMPGTHTTVMVIPDTMVSTADTTVLDGVDTMVDITGTPDTDTDTGSVMLRLKLNLRLRLKPTLPSSTPQMGRILWLWPLLWMGKISLIDLNRDLDFCHSIQVLHTQLPSDDVFKIVSKNF